MLQIPPSPAAASVASMTVVAGERITPRPAWVEAYAADPALSFVAREWDKSARVPGAWFDAALADKIVEVWPRYFRHTEGRWYNKPFVLAKWQEAIVRLLVGWKNADGFRLYRRLLLWVGKKNGKSEFMAALALLFFLFDKEPGGQGFCFAYNERQAKIVFAKMTAMIALSKPLKEAVTAFKKSLWCPEYRSLFELLPGSLKGRHGISASCVVGDEMHEWISDEVMTVLRQSTAARSQPIELYGSTAGVKGKGYGWDLFEETQALIDGRLHDPSTLAVIFALPPDADWTDEKLWPLANPNIGLSPTWEFLRAECAAAKTNPRREANFRRYHMNQWVSALVRWVPIARWDECVSDRESWRTMFDRMAGRACFSMVDLSKTRDVTALAHLFPPTDDDPKWHLAMRFFVPEAAIEERSRRDRVQYEYWHNIGALEHTPGDWVDQNHIKAAIQEDSKRFQIQAHGYDPWGATKLAQELIEEGAPMIEVRQGIPTLSEPSVKWEELVCARLLDHGGHPVLRWMMENVVLHMDRNGNFKPDKAASAEKIDGVVAGIGALALAIKAEAVPNVSEFLANAVMR